MKGKARRLLSWVCVLALCMSLLPVTALAAPTESGTQENPVTNTKNQVTVNKWVTGTGTEDNPYTLTMEAYASNEVTSTTTTKPLDIVLVLDVSGSMDEKFGDDVTYVSTGEKNWSYEDIDDSRNTYYYKVDGSYYEVDAKRDGDWGNRTYSIGYYTGDWRNPIWNQIGEVQDEERDTCWTGTLYTWERTTRLSAMKTAVNTFIDSVNENATKTGVDHQIGIVSFSDRARTVANPTSVTAGSNNLKDSVNHLGADGSTYVDEGMSMAKSMLDDVNQDSQKVVVVFTDGVPGQSTSWTYDSGSTAANAINTAKEMKDAGVTVYAVGIFEGADPSEDPEWEGSKDPNAYMHAMSSNFPNATATSEYGYYSSSFTVNNREGGSTANGYYLAASNASGLEDVFEGIADTVTDSTLEVYPDAQAVLTDTLSQYFNFPSSFNATEDVTAKYIPVSGKTGDTYTWDDSKPEDVKVQVTRDGDTIKITGFDYVEHAVTLENDEYSGGKLVVSFPIELDAVACLANPVADGLYPTNNTTNSKAGLAYKSSDKATQNDRETRLDQSPTVKVDNEDISANGTDVTVQVYVDGSPVTDPYNYVDLQRNTKDTTYDYWNDKLDAATGIISCDFNYNLDNGHDCVDIDVALKNNGYILQGVEWFQNVGSGNAHDINQNESPYTIDNVAADPEGNVDVKIYLNTVYSVQYYLNGAVYSENGYTDSTTYIANEGISEANYTELTEEIQNASQIWKNSGYSTSINVKNLPDVENSTVNGWWLDSNYEGDVDYNESATAQVKDTVPQDGTKVIKFYAKSTLNTGSVVINYRNEDGESIKNSETRTDTVGEIYNFDVSSDTNGDIPFVINHANDDGTTTKYVFDHFTEDSADLTGTYINGQQEITAVYKVDSDGDNKDIPDEYIATVTYKVVNGTWTETQNNEDKTANFELRTFDPETNTWVKRAPTLGDTIPAAQPNEDYLESSGAWYTGEEGNYETVSISKDTPVTEDITYTYCYTTEKNPALEVYKTVVSVGEVKVSDQDAIPVAKVGDTILYKIEVKNTGNVPLNDISIQDSLNFAAQTLYTDADCTAALNGNVSLGTNETDTYYAKYVVTAEDAGSFLINIAKATSGDTTSQDTVTVTVAKQYTLTVNYYYDSISEDNKFTPENTTLTYTLNANDPWSVEIGGSNGTHKAPTEVFKDGTHYTFDRVASTSPLSGKIIADDVVVDLVYSKDVIGGEDNPDTPDQIPDKYQVTIEYKAAEGGSIAENALTKEVKTIYAADDTTYAESGTVTATGSTATAAEGYFFNKWTKAVNASDAEDTSLSAATGSINLNTVTGGDVITFTAYFTKEDPKVSITKALTSVTRNEQQIGDLTAYTAQVGDQLIYTITVTNIGNMTLETVTVEDVFTGSGMLTFSSDAENVKVEGTTLTISNLSNEEGSNSVSIKATYIVQPDDISKDTIVNTANAYIGGKDDDPDGTDEETVRMDDYTVTITPADITIYTGGDGYSGVVTDEDGNVITETETSGLPEPGYHIDLPAAVESWLQEHDVDLEESAANLAGQLAFQYFDESGNIIRNWDLENQGVYSKNSDGTVSRYVYSLSPNTVEGENEGVQVRLAFTDDGNIVTTDNIRMDENTVSASYDMTIYDGGLQQSEIKAVFTAGGESITCTVKIGTGHLLVKSVTNEGTTTNGIEASSDAVTDTDTITAVADSNVTYYVNESEVSVPNDRVQLLVDEVSNSPDFDKAMGEDALERVAGEGNTLSNAVYDLAYMDLVDTQNGNTVVTMGEDQSLTIYWPVPDDAAEDSEFHVVHYTEMDRQNTTSESELGNAATIMPETDTTTINGQKYVTFTTESFSPFALVYEKAPDPVAKLEVTKTLTKVNGQPYTGGSVSVNDTLTYTITVKNGEVALNNVTITDTFNGKGDLVFNGYTATENPAGTYTINLGNLEANATVTITATYKVLRADASSDLTNAVKVNGTNPGGGENPTDEDKTPETPVNPYHPPIRPPVDPDKPELNTEDHYAYIVGYEDGSVQPEGDITRAEVATIFFRLLTDESRNEYWSQTNPYSDVSADDWFNNAVSTLTNAGVLDGYEDGTFKPNGNITRAEFATITARFFEATYDGENLFPDIEGHWAQDYINAAANAGIVNGYEDGTFRPQQYITRAEAVTMVNRTIERHPDADHLLDDMIVWPDNPETAWYYEQIQEATNSHEYTMNTDDEQNPYEIWTKLLPNRDWSELEKEWSDANDGAGSGEVV